MTIEQLNEIGREAANLVAGKYAVTNLGKVVIGFSISPNLEPGGYTTTVGISTEEGGMKEVYEIPNVEPSLFRSPNEARQYFGKKIEQFVRSYLQLG
jgi:hypothetical protein